MLQMTLNLTDQEVDAVAWQAHSEDGGIPVVDWVKSMVAGVLAETVARHNLATAPVDPMALQAGYLAAPADVQAQVADLLKDHTPPPTVVAAVAPVLTPAPDPLADLPPA